MGLEEYQEIQRRKYREIVQMELSVWEEAWGWFYWNYQLLRDRDAPTDESWKESWDLCHCMKNGFAQGETDVVIKISGKEYDAVFYDSKASGELLAKMPFQVKMSELNGNEKYRYLDDSFTEDKQDIGQIHAGDIMLYGSDCLVVFYKSFRTTYQYTKIGKITNPKGLESAVRNGSVEVSFSKASNRNSIPVRLTKKSLTLRPGKSKKIKLYGAKAGKVKWSTSNRKVAVVKGGKITAKKAGKAVITAKYKGKKYTCKVRVKTAKK